METTQPGWRQFEEVEISLKRETMDKVRAIADATGQSPEEWIVKRISEDLADPDPRYDLAGTIAAILGITRETLRGIQRLNDERTLTANQIAIRRGVSRSSIYEHPWRLPNFGVPDFSTRPRRWKLSTVLAWEAVDEDTHREEWEGMDGRSKAQIRKRSAAA